MGSTLSRNRDIEEYPLRSASEREGRQLKACLRSAFRAQKEHYKKTGKIFRKASEIPVDSSCDDLLLAQKTTDKGFEIVAEIRENETTVHWTINQSGVIEEHLDGSGEDQELEF